MAAPRHGIAPCSQRARGAPTSSPPGFRVSSRASHLSLPNAPAGALLRRALLPPPENPFHFQPLRVGRDGAVPRPHQPAGPAGASGGLLAALHTGAGGAPAPGAG